MNRRIRVLSVGTTILGNSVYHANLCASLGSSSQVEIIHRSIADYWDLWAKALFATFGSSRWGKASYRYRAEWVMSEVGRIGLQKDAKQLRPDVIHCHTQAHALRSGQIARHFPLVISMDATARRLQSMPTYASQQAALEKVGRMEDRIFKSCAALGSVSNWVIDSLENDYALQKERIHLCSPCVDTEFFKPLPSPTRSASDKVRIVFVGNDIERKGGRLLLELMAAGLGDVAELHIVSGTEPHDSLPPGVTWHRGLKPGTSALLEQLQLADIFALPTYEDCFPQALIEAMACGLPLISTSVMGIPEIVQDGVNGFCIPPRDKDSLARAVRQLAQSVDLRRRFASNSREIAEKRFSFATSQRAWENVFTQAAKTSPQFANN